MSKITVAQELADALLDECICQVGNDKGALPDIPEDVEDSMDDLEDYTTMEEESDEIVEERYLEKDEVDKLHKMRTGLANSYKNQSKHPTVQKINPYSTTNKLKRAADDKKRESTFNRKFSKANKGIIENESNQISTMVDNIASYLGEASLGAKIQLGIARNDKNYKEGNDMDPKAKANAKKRAETVKETEDIKGIIKKVQSDRRKGEFSKNTLKDIQRRSYYSAGRKMVTSDKLSDKQATNIGNRLDKAKVRVKESDQVAIAQQKDTLFDKLERVMKDKTDKDTSLNPEPTTEGSWLSSLQDWGKKKMNQKRKQGLQITSKRDRLLKDATADTGMKKTAEKA